MPQACNFIKKETLAQVLSCEFCKISKNTFFTDPVGTQRPEGVPVWSYFGRDVPDHNRTKIGRNSFLTYFGSAMFDLHLASGNIEKFPKKTTLWIMIKLTS